MTSCVDCGTKISYGLCPNCHEEAFIMDAQADYLPDALSDEFCQLADRQRADAHRRGLSASQSKGEE